MELAGVSYDFFSVFRKIIQNERMQNILKEEREDMASLHYNKLNRLPEGN